MIASFSKENAATTTSVTMDSIVATRTGSDMDHVVIWVITVRSASVIINVCRTIVTFLDVHNLMVDQEYHGKVKLMEE